MSSALFVRECAAAPWLLPLQSSRGTSNSPTSAGGSSSSGSSRRLHSRRFRICYRSPSSSDFRRNSQGSTGLAAAIPENRLNNSSSTALTSFALTGGLYLSSIVSEGSGRSGRSILRIRAETESGNGSSGDAEEEEVAGGGGGGGGGFSRLRKRVAIAVMDFCKAFARELKNETGFDSEVARDRVAAEYYVLRENIRHGLDMAQDELQTKAVEVRALVSSATRDVRHRYWPQFVNWNRLALWQDRTNWDVQRAGALVFYMLLVGAFLRGAHMTTSRPGKKAVEQTTDAFMETLVPEPTPANIRKFKKGLWREKMPKSFSVQKYKLDEDGEYEQDYSFPGDQPEEGDVDPDFDVDKAIDGSDLFTAEEKEQLKKDIKESKSTANLEPIDEDERVRARVDITKFIDQMDNITQEEKDQLKKEIAEEKARQALEKSQTASGQEEDNSYPGVKTITTWQERLVEWKKILQRESIKETLDTVTSKYEVEANWPEILAQIEEAKQEEAEAPKSMRAFWVARKWWKHRPKLPYTYLMAKVLNGEVRAAVYTEDMKKVYVTMKEGFPTDYVVDVPVDPTLYQVLEANGVEIDTLHRSNFYYDCRILVALLPSLLLIWYIREILYRARQRASEKIYDLLSMNRQHLILPEDAPDKARTQYKDVVIGGDVWQVIDEIMIYMRNPMKYHDRRVKMPRGILISGPPGTGKTLLARAIARESGLPFVFASGAEFTASGNSTGTDKVFDVFFTARANAPSFIFIDEIDALVGKGVKDDAERRATFEQLLSELDAEPEDTDVNRFAPRQAVILICATNRPDELDEEFMRPGRIDREIHIGLPGEEERMGIFDVHSQGKPLAKDVDFSKLVFRTIGYSGADIRNLINEAGIMAVRKGHVEVTQEDFSEVLDKQLFEGMGVVLMDEEQKKAEEKIPEHNKRLLAVHEAGHVLLAHLFPTFDWHAFSHLLPGGSDTALSVFYPREEMLQLGHTTVGYVQMQMVVAHGGRCAERLIYGADNISDGGQDDLARISSMARELTISPANSRLGLFPMKWRATMDPPELPGEVKLVPNEWDKPGTHIVNMSVEMSELFTREVTKYTEETEEIAMTALSQNRHILERLADLLYARTKLSGFEAGEIIRSMNPVLLPDYMSAPKPDFKSFEEKVTPPRMKGRYEELTIYQAPLPDW